jgi:hypothetical protein
MNNIMQKHNDGKIKLTCPNCGHYDYYELDSDDCEKVSSNVYQVWCRKCQEAFSYIEK